MQNQSNVNPLFVQLTDKEGQALLLRTDRIFGVRATDHKEKFSKVQYAWTDSANGSSTAEDITVKENLAQIANAITDAQDKQAKAYRA